MEKRNTDNAELFYSLRNAEIQMADAIICLGRAVIAIFMLLALGAATFLYEFANHWLLALSCAAILAASIGGIVLLWFLLPASADELFEDDEIQAAKAKQESWRL
jgi:hypothetical protein